MVKFNNKNVSLSHLWVSRNDRLSDFYASSWQREDSPVPMLVIRLILVLFSLGILTWSTIESNSPYWLIFLTNWGILLVTGTMLCSLIVSVVITVKKPYETTELPWYVSFYWLMFNLGVTISIMITCLYWILLYTPGIHDEGGLRALWLDITTHGITACIMLAELIISRTPVRLAHIYQPLGFGLWYVTFSGIYYVAGGTDALGNVYIYSVLNWEEGGQAAIVAVASCGALIVLYLILWTLAFCRDKISLNLVRTRSHDLPILPADHVDRRIV